MNLAMPYEEEYRKALREQLQRLNILSALFANMPKRTGEEAAVSWFNGNCHG